jgi:hypothetical protein
MPRAEYSDMRCLEFLYCAKYEYIAKAGSTAVKRGRKDLDRTPQ